MSITKLRDITEKLTTCSSVQSKSVKIKTAKGKIIIHNIFQNEQVGIMMSVAEKGSEFPSHIHNGSKTWMIIISGSGSLEKTDETISFQEQTMIELDVGVSHLGVFKEDTKFIAIFVPPDNTFFNTGVPLSMISQPRSNLEELKNLTEKLVTIGDVIKSVTSSNVIEFHTEYGTILGFPIYKDENIAIMRIFASYGTVLTEHQHENATEWMLIIKGSLELSCDGKVSTYRANDICMVPSSMNHSVYFSEDSWVIVITIPADPGFPEPHKFQ